MVSRVHYIYFLSHLDVFEENISEDTKIQGSQIESGTAMV